MTITTRELTEKINAWHAAMQRGAISLYVYQKLVYNLLQEAGLLPKEGG